MIKEQVHPSGVGIYAKSGENMLGVKDTHAVTFGAFNESNMARFFTKIENLPEGAAVDFKIKRTMKPSGENPNELIPDTDELTLTMPAALNLGGSWESLQQWSHLAQHDFSLEERGIYELFTVITMPDGRVFEHDSKSPFQIDFRDRTQVEDPLVEVNGKNVTFAAAVEDLPLGYSVAVEVTRTATYGPDGEVRTFPDPATTVITLNEADYDGRNYSVTVDYSGDSGVGMYNVDFVILNDEDGKERDLLLDMKFEILPQDFEILT